MAENKSFLIQWWENLRKLERPLEIILAMSLGENVKDKKQILQGMCNNMFYSNNSYVWKKWSSFCAYKPYFKSILTTSITGSITSSWRNTYCKRRKEYHKFSHSWQCSWSRTFEVCKQAAYSFSLVAGISHHAAVTLLISLCISLNCTLYRLLDRGKTN